MNHMGTVGSAALPVFRNLAREARIDRCLAVALVGYGRRGEELAHVLTRIPEVRVTAAADIWPWRLEQARERLRALGLALRTYGGLDELLAAEGAGVDAVIVATPDWLHAGQVTACLKAGKHVYCEGELASSLAKARELVLLAREKKRLVQGGHQRRSNPRYIHAFEIVCQKTKALGRVTHAYAQWHRAAAPFYVVPQRFALTTSALEANGYENMEQFLNWEWFRRYGLGSVAALAGQKLDLLRWFWRAEPVSVTAIGGYDSKGRENADSLMAIFTFVNSEQETVRGYVQILENVSRGASYEQFMGENAALTISEIAICGDAVQPEEERILKDPVARAALWNPHIYARRILPLREPPKSPEEEAANVDVRVTKNVPGWPLPVRLDKPALQPHLENFFAAIRGETVLSDPAERAFANLAALDGAVRSAALRCPVDFTPQDFAV
ncbi:MAG: Gfo/Idh/MocA family oxidoreductase [bacterium]